MEESEKSEWGVFFASGLLKSMAVPFIFLTCFCIVVLLILPLMTVVSSVEVPQSGNSAWWIYMLCMLVMIVNFSISTGFIKMSEIIKANYIAPKLRKSPKSHLYELVDNLFSLMAVVLIIGAALGLPALFFLSSVEEFNYPLSENLILLLVILFAGCFCVVIRKHILRASWWRISQH
jgi:hypothetical protein